MVNLSPGSVDSLGARLAMCVPAGGSNIELMSPADPAAPLSQSLSRFLERRGRGLFALMLEAPDPDAEADAMLGRGLKVLPLMQGAGGRDVHPVSTHGVLIRVYPTGSFLPPANTDRSTGATTGLSGIALVMIAVTDLDDAVAVYRDRLGITAAPPRVDDDRGVASVLLSPPSGGLIELLSVRDPSRPFAAALAGFMGFGDQSADQKEGLYGLVLETGNLSATSRELARRGVEVRRCDESEPAVECLREQTAGVLVRIEQRG